MAFLKAKRQRVKALEIQNKELLEDNLELIRRANMAEATLWFVKDGLRKTRTCTEGSLSELGNRLEKIGDAMEQIDTMLNDIDAQKSECWEMLNEVTIFAEAMKDLEEFCDCDPNNPIVRLGKEEEEADDHEESTL
jgi:hypothetical protein